jgi:hypothetical protein
VSGPLGVPQRSFAADFLAIAALGFVVFGFGFSWLASRSSTFGESFSDILWSTGIWSGLLFGIPMGLVLAFLLKPRPSSLAIESPTAFRARLREVLPKAKLAIQHEAGDEILIHPVKRPPLPILKEETILIQISGTQVTMTGGRMLVSRLAKKLRPR